MMENQYSVDIAAREKRRSDGKNQTFFNDFPADISHSALWGNYVCCSDRFQRNAISKARAS